MLSPSDRQSYLSRIIQARRKLFGDEGIADMAEALGIPPQTWANYEMGVMMPDTVILKFVCLTGAAPHWLLTGEGQQYSTHSKPVIQFG